MFINLKYPQKGKLHREKKGNCFQREILRIRYGKYGNVGEHNSCTLNANVIQQKPTLELLLYIKSTRTEGDKILRFSLCKKYYFFK